MVQTPGRKLQQIRESMGISLEEIAQKTRIRLNYLEAIESDDEELLPSTVQKRGFLRLYAAELGINLEELQVEGYREINADTSMPLVDASILPKEDQTTPDSGFEPEPEKNNVESPEKDEQEEPGEETSLQEPLVGTSTISQRESLETPEPRKTEHATAIFEAIGAKLQARRKLLSLSYDEIANHLHIRQTFLEALDAGQFEDLPSHVQARGMLANYAEFLNLDVDAILLEYADGLQVKRLEKQEQEWLQNTQLFLWLKHHNPKNKMVATNYKKVNIKECILTSII